ncbi:fibronectin type III domain-containing protein [Paenibacillus sp. SN-8-1]|uniref:fibronectin type III domain-containing protein n=1 Tax=Paenibacillus sp. SN-8-1 TaxID=3435409 RepID=UPI003D9A9561
MGKSRSSLKGMKWIAWLCIAMIFAVPLQSVIAPQHVYAATPSNENFDSAPTGSAAASIDVGDWTFDGGSTDGGNKPRVQIRLLNPSTTNNILLLGNNNRGQIEYSRVKSKTGPFKLTSFRVIERNATANQYTVSGYLEGNPVANAVKIFNPTTSQSYPVDFSGELPWGNIDEFRISASTKITLELDDLMVADPVVAVTNAAAPIITTQPSNQTVYEGGTANLTVAASGGVALSYQWYSNTTSSTSGGTPISGATSATYAAPTGTAGTMYYYVIVTNTDSSATGQTTATATSNVAKVQVNALTNAATPSITTQPSDQTVDEGSAATLTVAASGGVALSYQWYSNTTPSTSGGTSISGATSATYSAPTGTAGTMYYYVIVTNTDSSATGQTTATATSNVAKVQVNALTNAATPSIDTQPSDKTVNEGGTANLTVAASGGVALSYQWYSNTTPSTSGGTSISGATSATYSAPTGTVGTMYYYVIVKNTDSSATGQTTATATSNVAKVQVNANAATPVTNFDSTGKTMTTASFSWSAVSGATGIIIQQSPTGTNTWTTSTTDSIATNDTSATVTGLNPATEYDFRLVVTGGSNAGNSNVVSVTTDVSPVTSFISTGQTSTTASFSWSAVSGATGIIIQQSPKGDNTWTTSTTDSIATNDTSATVTGLNPATEYDFRLVVTGGSNAGNSNVESVTTDAPVPVSDFDSTGKTMTTASFSWSAVSGATAIIIQQAPTGTNTWTTSTTGTIATSATSATVTGLSPATEYDFRLVVTGGSNAGNSNVKSVTTDAPVPVSDFESTGKTITTASFGWSAVSGATEIIIEQSPKGTNTWSNATTSAAIATNATSATVTGLNPATEYDFRLVVTGGSNAGNSNVESVTTDAPVPVSDFDSTGKTMTTASFSWSAVSGATEIIIEQSPKGANTWSNATTSAAIATTATSATVTGLSPATEYDFRLVVTGGSNAGTSNLVNVMTNAPVPLGDFESTGKTMTTASFSWSAVNGATGISIEQSPKGANTWSNATTSAVIATTATSATVTGLSPATEYDFRLVVTGGSNAGNSNVESVTTDAPVPVSDFDSTGKTMTTASFSWSAVSGATAIIIQQAPTGTNTWTSATTSAAIATNATSATVTGLNPATEYDFRLVVTGGSNAGNSNVESVTTDAPVPVSDFDSTGKTMTTASFSWSAVSGATEIIIEQSPKGANTWSNATTSAAIATTATSATVTGLSPATEYDFRLVVTGGSNAGTSNLVNVMTNAPVPLGDFESTGKTMTTASFSWSAVSGATAIIIQQAPTGTNTWTSATTSAAIATNATSATVTGLSPATEYDFRLVVTGGSNAGVSNTVTVETDQVPPTYAIAPIGNQVLSPLTVGYTTKETKTITITRSGTGVLNQLGVALSGSHADDFIITQPTATVLDENVPATTFTIQAKNGLQPGTYVVTVKVTAAQMPDATFTTTQVVTSTQVVVPSVPVSNPPTPPAANTNVIVLVNGKEENAGTATKATINNQQVLTITVDQKTLEKKIEAEGKGAVITIPVQTDAEVVVGELNGQMIQYMENKQAVLVIQTPTATYTLPAGEINISALADQFGDKINLQDIKVKIEIAEPTSNILEVVEKAAANGAFTLVAPTFNFTVTGKYGNTSIPIEKFDAYVERTIAIPEGIDPNKITTGVVVEPDGSVRHVPTKVTKREGIYYAVINSLTNSTYSVVWHPLEFADVGNHWSREAVNDMGSRMVIEGTGEGQFSPNRHITRAEFAAIIVRGLGLKLEKGPAPFSDVKASEWYNDAINTAYAYKLINGYGDGTFGPNDQITREQAMVIIAKAMELTKLKDGLPAQDAETLLQPYADAVYASDWAISSIVDSIQSGVITGRSQTELAPDAYITRAEVAVIIQRLLQKSGLI